MSDEMTASYADALREVLRQRKGGVMSKMPRDPELHKLRHHRQAGPHGGARRPDRRSWLRPVWCPSCDETMVVEDADETCPNCEDDALQDFEE